MRIAVLGAGAMGSWYGGFLARAGHEVQLLTRNDEHIRAVTENGLEMRGAYGEFTVDLAISRPEEFRGGVELLLTLTKTFQLEQAMHCVQQSLDPATTVLSLQNGLGNAEVIERYVGRDNTFIGVSLLPIDKIAPGVLEATGKGGTWFGQIDGGQVDRAKAIQAAFSSTPLDVQHDPDILQRVWEKVAFNAGMNAVCALCHATPGLIGDSKAATLLLRDVADEVARVALAENVCIDNESVYRTIRFACEHHRNHKPSMLQYLLSGKTTEVSALNGAVVARGKNAGIDTPVNSMLDAMVQLAERGHSI